MPVSKTSREELYVPFLSPPQNLKQTATTAPSSSVNDGDTPALLHRSLVTRPHLVDHADGSYLYLADGRYILDACGGAAVAVIGHGNAEVIAATAAQMQRTSYIHTGAYTTTAAEDLAEFILECGTSVSGSDSYFDHGLTRAFFVGSGSEANESAMKIARQYFFERGELQRQHYVSRRQAYHGNTFGSMSVSSVLGRRVPYEDVLLPNVTFVNPAFEYHYRHNNETEEEYAERLIHELEAHFLEIGPEKIISFIVEPVVGATSGCVTAPKSYFSGVRSLCDKYGILLHFDEVMCGVGRTGSYFAFEQEDGGVLPDIVTIGKGLGGTSVFNHGHTFQAHPTACSAALAVQKIIRREGLVSRCADLGTRFGQRLRTEFGCCKYIGDVRGRGLFWALEFVQDKDTKTPFEPSVGFGAQIHQLAFDLGMAVYPCVGTVDGVVGDHILLAPPFNISDDELDIIISTLRRAYHEVELHYDNAMRGKVAV
ncbi:aminotransferase class-III domain-containing protein [Trichoderma breve]|uniref:Aminotransferase class-III domain-containing protein n=1 Tax=Trichoderma breve TaxID=2034170 RepID=A0A9W9JQ29_9HYPO|nr:aminotransferase class-III domain-containing protein [Trichoderma breve]KAJ4863430.1 aminotransferase class-III domain-containing protein [Trichoderma breve]